jgi:hypothetical protein
MSKLRRALLLASIALAATPAVALAAAAIKGATYTGNTVRGKAAITLKVSKSGKSVTVNAPVAPLYCQGGGGPERQITRAAGISKGGSFSGSIGYEFVLTHKLTARLFFKGKFSGHAVKGTARSEFVLAKSCDGSTTFTAKAK